MKEDTFSGFLLSVMFAATMLAVTITLTFFANACSNGIELQTKQRCFEQTKREECWK